MLADAVHDRRRGDHAGRVGRRSSGEQPAGEGEVAEVVGAELRLEAVGGAAQRERHDAGVVHEDVELVVDDRSSSAACSTEPRSARSSSSSRGSDAARHRAARRRAPPCPARGCGRRGSPRRRARPRPGRAQTEPAVGAGDDHRSTGLVGDLVVVPCAVCGHPARLPDRQRSCPGPIPRGRIDDGEWPAGRRTRSWFSSHDVTSMAIDRLSSSK